MSLWPFGLLATVPLALIRPIGRVVLFAVEGTFYGTVAYIPWGSGGLRGERMALAFWGLALSAAAMLAEIGARLARLRRRLQKMDPGSSPG